MPEILNWNEKKEKNDRLENSILRAIEKIECEGYELGEGRTAAVCAIDGYPDVCVKIINKEVKPRNNAKEEMRYLDELSKSKYPVPTPVCFARTEKAEYLFMEIIDGFSILDLIEKDLLDEIPEGFDFKNFFVELRDTLNRMHEEKKVFHRDLRPGNIMIDKNGKPVIIDFGESRRILLSTEDPYKDENSLGEANVLSRDEDRVAELYRTLGSYLKNKGYFQNKR